MRFAVIPYMTAHIISLSQRFYSNDIYLNLSATIIDFTQFSNSDTYYKKNNRAQISPVVLFSVNFYYVMKQ